MDVRPVDLTSMLKALGDQKRLEILMAVRLRELCACQLIEVIKIEGPSLSKHLATLMKVGLVSRRQQGKWAFFTYNPQISDPELIVIIENICQKAEVAANMCEFKKLVDKAALNIKCS